GDNFFSISEPDFEGNIVGDWNMSIFKQPTLVYFNADGTWSDPIYSGTWEMVGNGIRWDVVLPEDQSTAYALGIVEANEMVGTVVDPFESPADWYAERITPEVLTPNGGEVWMHGTQDSIKWDDSITGNVVISLADSVGVVQEIVTVSGDLGFYVWTVPVSIEPGAAYLIRVAKESNGEAFDESDNYFMISNTDVVDILGDWDMQGAWKWTTIWTFNSDGTWTNAFPEYGTWELTGNGLRWDYDTFDTYYIGVVDIDKMSGSMVESSGIVGQGWDGQRLLDITYPNGGEVFDRGDVITITWTDNLSADYVNIDLYENNVFVQSLFSNTINDNDQSWTIPVDLTISANYKIRITSTTSDIYDESDAFFTIQ
ncbi:MAG: hypothetical protein GQ534_07505, partial [Candidatus Delongbacteria bacterium]|nr:hypothetical protein [Candidatus Delongbacteria bacterium]